MEAQNPELIDVTAVNDKVKAAVESTSQWSGKQQKGNA